MTEAAKHTPTVTEEMVSRYKTTFGATLDAFEGDVADISREATKAGLEAVLHDAFEAQERLIETLTAVLKAIDDDWTSTFPGGPDGSREWAGGLGTLSDGTVERWKAIRTALALAEAIKLWNHRPKPSGDGDGKHRNPS